MNWRALNIASVLANPKPVVDFLLPNLVTGSLGLIAGEGGVGKTSFLMQLTTDFALGRAPLGGLAPASTPKRVLLLLAEETAQITAARVHDAVGRATAGGTSEQGETARLLAENMVIYPLSGVDVRLVSGGEAGEAFKRLQQLVEPFDVVMIDPIRRFHDGNENDSGDMTRLVQVLERITRPRSRTVLFTHHTNKVSALAGGSGDLQQYARGSSALTDGVRWQLNLSRLSAAEARKLGVSDSERMAYTRLYFAKANYGARTAPVLLKRTDDGALAVTKPKASASKRRAGGQLDWEAMGDD